MEIGGGENSWAARTRKLKMEMVDDDAEISRKLKSLLNKLSGENFDRIYLQMTEVFPMMLGQSQATVVLT